MVPVFTTSYIEGGEESYTRWKHFQLVMFTQEAPLTGSGFQGGPESDRIGMKITRSQF